MKLIEKNSFALTADPRSSTAMNVQSVITIERTFGNICRPNIVVYGTSAMSPAVARVWRKRRIWQGIRRLSMGFLSKVTHQFMVEKEKS
jgi:predicted metallopeptidase